MEQQLVLPKDKPSRLPRGPRHSHTEYRKKWQQSEQVVSLILELFGMTEAQTRRQDRRGNGVRRLIYHVHRKLGLPLRWHTAKPGPGFRWDGNVELANVHLLLEDYVDVLQAVVEHVHERLDPPLEG